MNEGGNLFLLLSFVNEMWVVCIKAGGMMVDGEREFLTFVCKKQIRE
jgi:hypothetical protein